MSQAIYMEEQDPPKQDNDSFLKNLESIATPEEKLKICINFMREALAQPESPNFKGFWEVRKMCLPLFKEIETPQVRTQLWSEYIELTREGRRLKNLLDEETAFAVDQIDLAIEALENEIKGYHTHSDEILNKTEDIEFPKNTQTLIERFDFFQKLQKQLVLLNFYASRINALRKELIRTEMRIRQKNKFFQTLSHLGDQVFPIRKELIQEISTAFVEDVSGFVNANFAEGHFDEAEARRSVFYLREEIKNLQTTAKILTLNTHAFSMTREMLSGCWDKLKGMEKELKKEYAEHKHKSSENASQVKERIDSFMRGFEEKSFSHEEALNELDAISRWMRDLQLTRNDVRTLRTLIKEAREPLEQQKDEALHEKRKREAEFEKVRHEKIETFKNQVEALQKKLAADSDSMELLTQELDEVRKALISLPFSKLEKQQLERTLKIIRDQIAEKQSQALLTLSDDDRAALENLEKMLDERTERRKEIKNQIEEYRKIIGGSGLDFEKAMRYNELMDAEKETLGKIDESIAEIKKKMRHIQKS